MHVYDVLAIKWESMTKSQQLKETLSSTTFVNCAGLCAVVFPPLNIFVLSSEPAEKLYYMYLDQKNPLRKYYLPLQACPLRACN